MSESILSRLIQDASLWRGRQWHNPECVAIASGYPALDSLLAGGGWPASGITELLCEQTGIGELSLLLPALGILSQQPRWQAWISPPCIPYAGALKHQGNLLARLLLISASTHKDRLWAAEQALLSGACSAVLCWPEHLKNVEWRRLQRAAMAGKCCGFIFTKPATASHNAPVPLRIQLKATVSGLHLQLLKRLGGWPVDTLVTLPRL